MKKKENEAYEFTFLYNQSEPAANENAVDSESSEGAGATEASGKDPGEKSKNKLLFILRLFFLHRIYQFLCY